jgi:murein DD-endopeptidase MepM/ murein hydrolase activator NlpD
LNRAIAVLILVVALGGGVAVGAYERVDAVQPVHRLPAARATGIQFDTLMLGGYAAGSFEEAVQELASTLTEAERTMVGEHLDRIFAGLLTEDGLGRTGRLRVVYERALRPDGTTRSLRVLTAEVAARGRLHTAYYFERSGRAGYFDDVGRSLGGDVWAGPLARVRVSSAFGGSRMHPILNRLLPHTGVDLAAPAGEPVHATADGVVGDAGARGGYGLLVEIQHPSGFSTRYAHLSRIAANLHSGSSVRQGDVVGYVGMTGTATGPHLHYEVRRSGQAVDPMSVSADAQLSPQVSADPRWSAQKRALGSLLARAPTLLRL